jgi:hypothetical protein
MFEPNCSTAHLSYIRSRNGILGYPKDIEIPTQLIPRLSIEQLNGKHAVSVCVFYDNCRSSVIMGRQTCLIGQVVGSGHYRLELSTETYMWNRPLLGIGHKMNGAIILILGEVKHELGPPFCPHEYTRGARSTGHKAADESTTCDVDITNLRMLADAAMSIS